MRLPRAIGLLFVCALASCTATTKTEGAKEGADPSMSSSSGHTAREVGSLVIDGVPEIPAALTERLRRYQNVRSAMLFGWLDDGLLIGTRFAETTQVHRVDAPLGMRRQLTFATEPILEAWPSPRGDAYVYAKDIGGSEFYQLYRADSLSGETKLLTDGKSRYGQVVWAHDGSRFAYSTTERNGRDWDIHLQDDAGDVSVALEAEGSWRPLDFSPDGTRLLVMQFVSANESHVWEIDLASGDRRSLLAPEPSATRDSARGKLLAAMGDARYDGTGKRVFFTSDVGAEFLRLHRIDLATRKIEVLTGDVPWDVELIDVSRDGRRLAFVTNEDGLSRVHLRALPELAYLALPALPAGVIDLISFSPDGERLALSLTNAATPMDNYVIDLPTRKLERWTQSELAGLDPRHLKLPELIRYPTFDRLDGAAREIPAFLYMPEGSGPFPVVIDIHGGPEAQFRPRFIASLQYLVGELGIAVIAPNVRGSSGYGKTYLTLDNGYRREDSVKDIGALLDWIATRPELDSTRVAVRGGSYGGYMVLASLVHFGDRLAAGIDSVGISNFVTFLTATQDYRRDLRRVEYGDERDPRMREFLTEISPLTHADVISTPLLIAQGSNDPRVPAAESDQIVAALRARGLPVWYILARDEGHGFAKRTNRDYLLAASMLFLAQQLGIEPAQ
jgi:dipeptidyl aminopeptidase/acylaminoacyl peptidase